MIYPTPEEIKAARIAARLTPPKAAALIYLNRTNWTRAEAGQTKMHPAFFELFLIKTGQKVLDR